MVDLVKRVVCHPGRSISLAAIVAVACALAPPAPAQPASNLTQQLAYQAGQGVAGYFDTLVLIDQALQYSVAMRRISAAQAAASLRERAAWFAGSDVRAIDPSVAAEHRAAMTQLMQQVESGIRTSNRWPAGRNANDSRALAQRTLQGLRTDYEQKLARGLGPTATASALITVLAWTRGETQAAGNADWFAGEAQRIGDATQPLVTAAANAAAAQMPRGGAVAQSGTGAPAPTPPAPWPTTPGVTVAPAAPNMDGLVLVPPAPGATMVIDGKVYPAPPQFVYPGTPSNAAPGPLPPVVQAQPQPYPGVPLGGHPGFSSWQPGQDIYDGGDYRSFAIPSADPNVCLQECARDSRCRAVTYTMPGTYGAANAACWLKSRTGRFGPHASALSAVKTDQPGVVMPQLAVGGAWLFRGIAGQNAYITQNGSNLQLRTERNAAGSGRVESATTFVADFPFGRVRGTVTPDGRRINWSNGEFWTREPVAVTAPPPVVSRPAPPAPPPVATRPPAPPPVPPGPACANIGGRWSDPTSGYHIWVDVEGKVGRWALGGFDPNPDRIGPYTCLGNNVFRFVSDSGSWIIERTLRADGKLIERRPTGEQVIMQR